MAARQEVPDLLRVHTQKFHEVPREAWNTQGWEGEDHFTVFPNVANVFPSTPLTAMRCTSAVRRA
jgi:hypothetical protein